MKLNKSHLRGHQAAKPGTTSKVQKALGKKWDTTRFMQTLFFEKDALVTVDEASILRVPYASGEAGALTGLQLEAGHAREIVKGLPRGKLDGSIEVTRSGEKISFKPLHGAAIEVPVFKPNTGPKTFPVDWRRKVPAGAANEVTVDGERFKKLVSNIVKAEKDLMGKPQKGQPRQPVLIRLRVNANADMPIQIHGSRGVFGMLAAWATKVANAISKTVAGAQPAATSEAKAELAGASK